VEKDDGGTAIGGFPVGGADDVEFQFAVADAFVGVGLADGGLGLRGEGGCDNEDETGAGQTEEIHGVARSGR
jgi:hypothetical protein